jgi:DnaA family protein
MANSLFSQLPLSFPVREEYTFDNFVVGNNLAVTQQLMQAKEPDAGQFIYLWGRSGVGCSHLLQACCQYVGTQGLTAMYLPLDQLRQYDAAALEGIESVDLVCIDHLDAIVGERPWEIALFHLFNRLLDSGSTLLVASSKPVRLLDLALADLASRLSSCLIYQVTALDDDHLVLLLQQRARVKGIALSIEVAHFIVNRSERSVTALLAILEQLDHHALSAGRRLTVPFVKEVMCW